MVFSSGSELSRGRPRAWEEVESLQAFDFADRSWCAQFASAPSILILRHVFRDERILIGFLLTLCQAADTFLHDQVLFFSNFRFRIDAGQQIAVTLHQSCGHGTKGDIALQPVEN